MVALPTAPAESMETHLQEEDFHRMQKLWVGAVYGAPAVGRKAGVLTRR